MASLLFPDDPQQQPGASAQGLLAIPSGDWRDTIAPQPTQADAADATAREYRAFQERDRQAQIDQGYVNPQTGERTPEGWRNQAQTIAGGFGPADIGMATGLLGSIKAYHGSPHSFDAFDMSKIGTGEGAQAYGHGLYFAENEGIARGYRDKLTNPGVPLYQGKTIGRGDAAYDDVGSWLEPPKPGETMQDMITRRAGEIRQLGDFMGASGDKYGRDRATEYHSAADKLLKANPADWSIPTGHMYEVNLNAEPDQMLHWDKPLSEQSPQVQQAVASLGIKLPHANPPGGAIHTRLADTLVPGNFNEGQVAAAQALRAAGIPGISYLDAGSRGGGKGTSNHVIFDDARIEMMRKYGIAGLMAGGAATAFGGQQDQNQ